MDFNLLANTDMVSIWAVTQFVQISMTTIDTNLAMAMAMEGDKDDKQDMAIWEDFTHHINVDDYYKLVIIY